MDTFDISKSIISGEDLLDGVDFINAFSNELSEYSGRITGTESETACARALRDRLHQESNVKTRLEAYKAYPLLGRGAFPLIGLWYVLSLALYYLSFAGGRIAGILLTVLSLVVFITGIVLLSMLFLGSTRLKGLLTQKVSYNVVSEFSKPFTDTSDVDKKERIFIIAANHDDLLGSVSRNFGKLRKITMVLAPVSVIIFVLFCIIKIAVGTETTATLVTFIILPTVFSLIGIAVFMTHFSLSPYHARPNNGISTSVAMATFSYFAEQPDLVPEGVRIVYASFGGENSGHGGSAAFVASHPEFAGAQVLCIGDIQSGNIRVAECDSLRNIKFSKQLVSIAKSSAHEQDINLTSIPYEGLANKFNSLHGYISGSFAKEGIKSVTLTAKSYKEEGKVLDRNDIEKLFSITVGTVQKLMNEDIKESISEISAPVSTNMEIVNAQGK
ncbi:MAG: hypothetical protein MJ068_01690 [Clostridia bacterium]|nr:hypothetical protein [Clostridia bacterium]